MPPVEVIFPIVEGHGEQEAIPVLLRRMAEYCGKFNVTVLPPYRLSKNTIIHRPERFDAVLRLAEGRLRETGSGAGLVICLDSDGDDPVKLRNTIQTRLEDIDNEIKTCPIIPVREYEAWFLAAAAGFREHPRCRADAAYDGDPEAVNGAKQRFEAVVLRDGEVYSETVDQAKFTALMNFELARRCHSFERFMSDMSSWFSEE
jgi:hypothetical protein